MAVLSLVSYVILLNGCTTPTASEPSMQIRDWPDKPDNVSKMSERDIARYLVEGHAAYKSCKAVMGEK